jgi:hypothetical protein
MARPTTTSTLTVCAAFWTITARLLDDSCTCRSFQFPCEFRLFDAMRLRLHFFSLLLFLLPAIVFSQTPSLSGIWMGKLIQNEKPPFGEYRFRLELKQEGNRVVGFSHISMPDSAEIYGRMRLEGIVKNGIFTFHEIEMLESNHYPDWGWCLKSCDLTLKQVGEFQRLEGKWEGYMDDFPCKPGTITLEKLNQKAKTTTPTVAKPEEKNVEGNFGVIEGRPVTHQKEVQVYREELTIYLWDGDKVDGDIVSLQFNDTWLIRKYTISKTKKVFQIKIDPANENQLTLFAENLGQYPPNTAALTFFDGKQERNLNLSSDKSGCGALKFVFVK